MPHQKSSHLSSTQNLPAQRLDTYFEKVTNEILWEGDQQLVTYMQDFLEPVYDECSSLSVAI